MNNKEWIKNIINDNVRYTIPIMTHPGIEMIGCSVKDAVQNGKIQAQAICALSKKYLSKKVKKKSYACDICNNSTCIYRNVKGKNF